MAAISPAQRIPRVFVGSSTEAGRVADAVAEELNRASANHDALALLDVRPWGLMETAETVFASLIRAADTFDFGAFVFAADDHVVSRGDVRLLLCLRARGSGAATLRQPRRVPPASSPRQGATGADALRGPRPPDEVRDRQEALP